MGSFLMIHSIKGAKRREERRGERRQLHFLFPPSRKTTTIFACLTGSVAVAVAPSSSSLSSSNSLGWICISERRQKGKIKQGGEKRGTLEREGALFACLHLKRTTLGFFPPFSLSFDFAEERRSSIST